MIPATLADLFGNSSRTPPPSCATYGTADSFGFGYYGSASEVLGWGHARDGCEDNVA